MFMCNNNFAKEKFKELDEFIERIEGEKKNELIAVLHKAQHIFGYLPKEIQLYIARKLSIPAAKVHGVVTFYSYFTETPKGKYVISVCLGTACFVKGAGEILAELESKLKIKAQQTTEDGKFTIDALRCIGACGLAPVIIVDGKVHGRLTKENIDEIIESCK